MDRRMFVCSVAGGLLTVPLGTHALDEEDIWDVGAIVASFALSNRMANLTAMRPNDAFFTMGR